ncbi:MAG: sigma-70 family RNA polymerase sigma factor [Candidatus Cloacimonetes bacterium]|nr:sigma-70 family RNA polymerase sigma factor [Candidatus Cloacimonadota bacterium]
MNRCSFEAILKNEGNKIFNYLMKILRHSEDAEDIMQDVFISFYKKMDTVNEKAFLTYLYRTARNKALNLIKSRQRKYKLNKTMQWEAEQVTDHENVITERKSQILAHALSKLKPEEYILLDMQYNDRKSYRIIAEELNTTIPAVESKLVRIKKKLRKIILQDSLNQDVLNYKGENDEVQDTL